MWGQSACSVMIYMIPLAFSRVCRISIYLFIQKTYMTALWHDLRLTSVAIWQPCVNVLKLLPIYKCHSTHCVILHKVLFMNYLLSYVVPSVMVQVFIFVQFVDYFWFTCFTGAVFTPSTTDMVLECESYLLFRKWVKVLACPQCVLIIVIVILLVLVRRALVVSDSFTRLTPSFLT